MYYGRIDARGFVSPERQKDENGNFIPLTEEQIEKMNVEEVKEITKYLNRVHNYRVNGSNLPEDAQKRAFVFNDCSDFKIFKDSINVYNKVFSEIRGIFDDKETNLENYRTQLNEGAQFFTTDIHSFYGGHQMHLADNGYEEYGNYDINDIFGGIEPKFHFANLYCCSACRFEDQGEPVNNLGANYLFGNNYALNVNGSTGSWGPSVDDRVYEMIFDGKTVGDAYKQFFVYNVDDDHNKSVLLGDPTIIYKINKLDTTTPVITTNLAGNQDQLNFTVKAGVQTTLARNYESGVYYTVEGLNTTNLINRSSGVWWTATESQIGQTYPCKIKAYKKDANNNITNSYEEKFNITVEPKGTTYEAENYGGTPYDVKYCSGHKKAGSIGFDSKIVIDDIYSSFDRTAKIYVYYICGDANGRTGTLKVEADGGIYDTANLSFANQNGSWQKVAMLQTQVRLKKGTNKIILGNDNGWCADIDKIIIK